MLLILDFQIFQSMILIIQKSKVILCTEEEMFLLIWLLNFKQKRK